MTEQEAKELLEQLPVYRYEQEVQMYQHSDVFNALDMGIKALEEVQQYRALGTVEELKEAKEKQVAKKPKYEDEFCVYLCSNCDDVVFVKQKHCERCGQKLGWGNEDE